MSPPKAAPSYVIDSQAVEPSAPSKIAHFPASAEPFAPYFATANENLQPADSLGEAVRRTGRVILAADGAAMAAAFSLAGAAALALPPAQPEALRHAMISMALALAGLFWFSLRGHYRERLPFWEGMRDVASALCAGLLAAGLIQLAAPGLASLVWIAGGVLVAAPMLVIFRRLAVRALTRSGQWRIPAVLVGSGPSADAARRALEGDDTFGFHIVKQVPATSLATLSVSGTWAQLLAANGANHVFVALDGTQTQQQEAALRQLARERLPYSMVPPWAGLPGAALKPRHFALSDAMVLQHSSALQHRLPCALKRALDMFVAGTALLIASPVFIALTVLVRRDGGPAFFSQPRVGRNGKEFPCYKFRSMRVDAEEYLTHYLASNPEAAAEWQQYQKLKEDVRITRFGRFIRRTSLDELPQLLNVLKGDMSLVGPRPIMPGQESYYAEDFSYYCCVRPGITGPWQVSGRNRLTFKERVVLEACYARNWSLWLDIVILFKTIPVVLKRDQAY